MNFSKDYKQFITNLEECLEDPLDFQFLQLMEKTATKVFKPQYNLLLPTKALEKPKYNCQCCKEQLEFPSADLLIKHIIDKSDIRLRKIRERKITKTCRCCKVPKNFDNNVRRLISHTRAVASARINAIKQKQKKLANLEGLEKNDDLEYEDDE